jgi:cytosine/adenosine deaminase-related metal-dependent hydrolase
MPVTRRRRRNAAPPPPPTPVRVAHAPVVQTPDDPHTLTFSQDGKRFIIDVRDAGRVVATLRLSPREAVAVAARMLAGAEALFRDEDMRIAARIG